MSDAIERFLKWKHKQVEDTWPLALLSPVYDVGLVLGLFKTPAQYRQSQYWQPSPIRHLPMAWVLALVAAVRSSPMSTSVIGVELA